MFYLLPLNYTYLCHKDLANNRTQIKNRTQVRTSHYTVGQWEERRINCAVGSYLLTGSEISHGLVYMGDNIENH